MFWLGVNQKNASAGVTVIIVASTMFSLVSIVATSYAIFLTPLWQFIKTNREVKASLVLVSIGTLILMPLCLSCYVSMTGGSIALAVLLGLVSGFAFARGVDFLDCELFSSCFYRTAK